MHWFLMMLALAADRPNNHDRVNSRFRFFSAGAFVASGGGCSPVAGSAGPTGYSAVSSVANTVTPNYGTSPDCTQNSVRVQFPAVGGGYSTLFSPGAVCPNDGLSHTASIYGKAVSAGSFNICVVTSAGPTYNCNTVNATTGWTMISRTAVNTSGGECGSGAGACGGLVIGLTDSFDGTSPTAAIDIEFWNPVCP